MRTTKVIRTAVLVLLLAGVMVAQEPSQEQSEQMQAMRQKMMQAGQERMAERNALLEKLQASEQRLDALVAVMNSSAGNAKTDATAAVVAELVAQRQDLLDVVQLEPGMMQQMMQMMQMEGAARPEDEQP